MFQFAYKINIRRINQLKKTSLIRTTFVTRKRKNLYFDRWDFRFFNRSKKNISFLVYFFPFGSTELNWEQGDWEAKCAIKTSSSLHVLRAYVLIRVIVWIWLADTLPGPLVSSNEPASMACCGKLNVKGKPTSVLYEAEKPVTCSLYLVTGNWGALSEHQWSQEDAVILLANFFAKPRYITDPYVLIKHLKITNKSSKVEFLIVFMRLKKVCNVEYFGRISPSSN